MNSITWGASKEEEYTIFHSPTNSFMIERVVRIKSGYKNEVIVLILRSTDHLTQTTHIVHTLYHKKGSRKKMFFSDKPACQSQLRMVLEDNLIQSFSHFNNTLCKPSPRFIFENMQIQTGDAFYFDRRMMFV